MTTGNQKRNDMSETVTLSQARQIIKALASDDQDDILGVVEQHLLAGDR